MNDQNKTNICSEKVRVYACVDVMLCDVDHIMCMHVYVCMCKGNVPPRNNNKRTAPLTIDEQHNVWKRLKTHHTTPDAS